MSKDLDFLKVENDEVNQISQRNAIANILFGDIDEMTDDIEAIDNALATKASSTRDNTDKKEKLEKKLELYKSKLETENKNHKEAIVSIEEKYKKSLEKEETLHSSEVERINNQINGVLEKLGILN